MDCWIRTLVLCLRSTGGKPLPTAKSLQERFPVDPAPERGPSGTAGCP